MAITVLAAAGAAAAKTAATVGQAAAATAKVGAQAGTAAAKAGGQVAANTAQAASATAKAGEAVGAGANTAQTLATNAAHGGNSAVPHQNVMDLKTGKTLPDETLRSIQSSAEAASHCPIEGHGGTWAEGVRGNGLWKPEGTAVPTRYNPEGKTWNNILRDNGMERNGVEYVKGSPDFNGSVKATVEIPNFTGNRPVNFAQADELWARQQGCSPRDAKILRTQNRWTWHECADCKTMQLVPSEVHANIDHSGGISAVKRIAA